MLEATLFPIVANTFSGIKSGINPDFLVLVLILTDGYEIVFRKTWETFKSGEHFF